MGKRYEKSSGGVVYRIKNNKVEILLLKWINSRGQEDYVIPKGHIEEGEIASEAALREIEEETGLAKKDLRIIKFLTKLNYTFTAGYLEDNPVIDKDVYLFLVKYCGDDTPRVQKSERFVDYRWFTPEEIKTMGIRFNLHKIVNKNLSYFV
ncbi:MAG: NUDIX domain-containing protein [Candidatus Gracilibacteria bacterium]|nr:NUDIX domain-containing protein [Candidatus Gracilibacteria bacterium]